MEDSLVQIKKKNGWKVTGIIFIILAVLSIAAGVFFGLKYSEQGKKIDDLANQISKLEQSKKDDKKIDNGSRFFSVKEWGIKFEIPYGIDNIKYEIIEGKELAFTTDGIESVCSDSMGAVGAVIRSDSPRKAASVEDTTGTGGDLLNENAIDGHYFFFVHPQAVCAQGDDMLIHGDQMALIRAMVRTISEE